MGRLHCTIRTTKAGEGAILLCFFIGQEHLHKDAFPVSCCYTIVYYAILYYTGAKLVLQYHRNHVITLALTPNRFCYWNVKRGEQIFVECSAGVTTVYFIRKYRERLHSPRSCILVHDAASHTRRTVVLYCTAVYCTVLCERDTFIWGILLYDLNDLNDLLSVLFQHPNV